MIKSTVLVLILFVLNLACSTTNRVPYGIQEGHVAYIPARIAVWPCQMWPNSARYSQQLVTNASKSDISSICDEVDSYMIKGFQDQPYMRGLSPKVVKALLAKAENADMLDQFPELWQQRSGDCLDCLNPISYYKKSIADRETWQQWLNKLSDNVYNSDASLVPLLTYAKNGRVDDRGIGKAYFQVGIVVLLVDNNNGRLIWAGGRHAKVINQKIKGSAPLEELTIPDWTDLRSRLLVKDIWREFPGRQNF